jgi:hypothetical protein
VQLKLLHHCLLDKKKKNSKKFDSLLKHSVREPLWRFLQEYPDDHRR